MHRTVCAISFREYICLSAFNMCIHIIEQNSERTTSVLFASRGFFFFFFFTVIKSDVFGKQLLQQTCGFLCFCSVLGFRLMKQAPDFHIIWSSVFMRSLSSQIISQNTLSVLLEISHPKWIKNWSCVLSYKDLPYFSVYLELLVSASLLFMIPRAPTPPEKPLWRELPQTVLGYPLADSESCFCMMARDTLFEAARSFMEIISPDNLRPSLSLSQGPSESGE